MMRIDQSRFLMLTLLVVAVWGSSVYAQQITGAVTGTVLDSSGAAVVGASVTLTNTGTAFAQTTNTDASGNFQFLLLQPGSHSGGMESSSKRIAH
jgi:protocatechuate 3,4-dioxygenase beta subunit